MCSVQMRNFGGLHARQLRGAELNYSATKLEALAVITTVEHFAHYLFGKNSRSTRITRLW